MKQYFHSINLPHHFFSEYLKKLAFIPHLAQPWKQKQYMHVCGLQRNVNGVGRPLCVGDAGSLSDRRLRGDTQPWGRKGLGSRGVPGAGRSAGGLRARGLRSARSECPSTPSPEPPSRTCPPRTPPAPPPPRGLIFPAGPPCPHGAAAVPWAWLPPPPRVRSSGRFGRWNKLRSRPSPGPRPSVQQRQPLGGSLETCATPFTHSRIFPKTTAVPV